MGTVPTRGYRTDSVDEPRGRTERDAAVASASPFSPAAVAASRVSVHDLVAAGGALYWLESRPVEAGRNVVVRWRPGEPAADASPSGTSVRSRVHEYGGGAFVCLDGTLVVVDADDQQVYRLDGRGDHVRRRRCSPEADGPGRRRYGDLQIGPSPWLLAVEEEHGSARVAHRLVALATEGPVRRSVLVDDGSFVAAPRLSPDGSLVAWVTWRHPNLPWDRSALWAARLGRDSEGAPVLSGLAPLVDEPGSSVGQPRWRPDGSLSWMWDQSGWWLPYVAAVADEAGGVPGTPLRLAGPAIPMVPLGTRSEFHAPDWALGQRTAVDLDDGSVVCRMRADGVDQLVRLVPEAPSATTATPGAPPPPARPPAVWRLEPVVQPCVAIEGVASLAGDEVGVLGATPQEAAVVVVVTASGAERSRTSRQPPVPWSPASVAPWRVVVVPGPDGPLPGLFFAARGRRRRGGLPPLVLFCHGGPTGGVDPGFDPLVQACTSRGLAVGAVDYRGSSGHGRAYRQALHHAWGVADAADCVAFARGLASLGWVDGERMAVRGTSAGGLTALNALSRDDAFGGAVVWYGVTDLEALAADTHDFESHYLDWLVGPLATHRARYEERSPLRHPERLRGSVLLLQGTEDPVVPAAHVRAFARRASGSGVDVRLIELVGEGHGVRRADSLERCISAELDFYDEVFGTGPGSVGPGASS